ncbi:MAG: NADH-quinone oxidoreductase subunit C [Bacteroidia bacterium]|nr:NADH-quinone oxidoreductase subunit C [Bacteroidia bacterium]MCZ2276481.1 NADH-quinone oxidoreductase subunit C [Bacteroidia bacterium]
MTNEEIKNKISNLYPSVTFDETSQWLQTYIESVSFLPFAEFLQNDRELNFDYLFCLTCVDWKTHLTMVYHFTSTFSRHILVVKSQLNRENPVIHTVSHIWRTAEFHEREVFDLFGVKFTNHPDLRRLLLTDDWNGYPLRKDYQDPVNMIKL